MKNFNFRFANFVGSFILLFAMIFLVKHVYFITFYSPKNKSVLHAESKPRTVEPIRGTIYDTNGKPLALATPSYTIAIDCAAHYDSWSADLATISKDRKITDPERERKRREQNEKFWEDTLKTVTRELDKIFSGSFDCKKLYSGGAEGLENAILAGRKNNKRYLVIARNVNYDSYQKLKDLPLLSKTTFKNPITGKKETFSGCLSIPSEKNGTYKIVRNYPYGQLARKVIGEANDINRSNNRTGIEGRYDAVLRGTPGTVYERTVDGYKTMVDMDSLNVEVQNGIDITTTLDVRIQEIAHRALLKRLNEISFDPKRPRPCTAGTAIVMDTETGAIRAMVNLGYDEKDNRWKENQMNMAVTMPSAPGSVFKSVLTMQLLEDKKITLDTKVPTYKGFYDAGRFAKAKGAKYDDKDLFPSFLTRYFGYSGRQLDSITVRDGFAVSSNNVFRYLVVHHYGDNPDPYVNRIYQLKLREALDFDIEHMPTPGFPGDPLTKGPTLPTLAIGTNIDITPLHVLTLYNAIANDGKMIQPYLIDYFSRDGQILEDANFGNTGPRVLNPSICSEATAKTLKEALRGVFTYGTAKTKGLKEDVAGKTGTARYFKEFKDENGNVIARGYKSPDGKMCYQATLVGFWPYENPRYTAIIVMYGKPVIPSDSNTLYGSAGVPAFKEIVNNIHALGL